MFHVKLWDSISLANFHRISFLSMYLNQKRRKMSPYFDPFSIRVDICFLWHISCQSEFDELVSLASRPVDRGFDRMAETKVPFHPVKCGFGRMAKHTTHRQNL